MKIASIIARYLFALIFIVFSQYHAAFQGILFGERQ